MRREVNSVDELRAIVGRPNKYVANKVGRRLSAVQQDCVAHSPPGFLATTDAQVAVLICLQLVALTATNCIQAVPLRSG
jgi:hypothetical protein